MHIPPGFNSVTPYLFVDHAEESMIRAIDAGATKIMDVSDMPYEDRQGGVRDPCGNIWWILQRLTDEPYQVGRSPRQVAGLLW